MALCGEESVRWFFFFPFAFLCSTIAYNAGMYGMWGVFFVGSYIISSLCLPPRGGGGAWTFTWKKRSGGKATEVEKYIVCREREREWEGGRESMCRRWCFSKELSFRLPTSMLPLDYIIPLKWREGAVGLSMSSELVTFFQICSDLWDFMGNGIIEEETPCFFHGDILAEMW